MHYLFVTRDEFESLIAGGDLLEWAEFNDHLYGTPDTPVREAIAGGKDILLDIEIQGARQVRARFPDALMIFIAPPSLSELERRLRERGDTTEEDIADRLQMAAELDASSELFDHVVINDVAERAITEVIDLVSR